MRNKSAAPLAFVMMALTLTLGVSSASAQDQAFTSLAPCVLFDTRPAQGGTGALAANEARNFHIVGSTANFAGQGGTAGGCKIPGFVSGKARVKSILINLVAIEATGGGNLKIWATDQAETSGGVVNYQALAPAMNNSNTAAVEVRQNVQGNDIFVRANGASVQVRGVALGFFREICDASTGVQFENKCYYLDGTNGVCDEGYTLAPQSVLTDIATFFTGRNYRSVVSDNCCIKHANQAAEGQDWGHSGACNAEGPFPSGPTLGGVGCTNANQNDPNQLTLCVSQ